MWGRQAVELRLDLFTKDGKLHPMPLSNAGLCRGAYSKVFEKCVREERGEPQKVLRGGEVWMEWKGLNWHFQIGEQGA